MSAGKVSIFITVISLHACVLGIVFVSTRKPAATVIPEKAQAHTSNDATNKVIKTPAKKPPVSVKKPPVNVKRQVVRAPARIPANTPAPASSNKNYRIHTVGPNDYLGKIASKYKVTSKSIIKLNGITDPNRINRGQKLKIPIN